MEEKARQSLNFVSRSKNTKEIQENEGYRIEIMLGAELEATILN
jgi:hypothetical protein